MNQLRIPVPKRLELKDSLQFAQRIDAIDASSSVVFDFSSMNFVGPFGFVLISSKIRELVRRLPQGNVMASNYEGHSYHAHMGFFNAFGLEYGNKPGEAKGSGTYIPITIEEVAEIHETSLLSGAPIGEIVEDKAQRLAKILARSDDTELFKIFVYSLREIIRNVAEHSESQYFCYCAQYWNTQDRAEIAILDRGVGIQKTLSRNPYLKIENQEQALNLALLPGISGVGYKGAKGNDASGGWHNSGYGLYMTNRMCRNGGNFFIGSMDSSIYLEGGNKMYLPFNHTGTIVRMVFRPSSIQKIQDALDQYRQEGEKIAKDIEGAIISASAASHMLRCDFKIG